MLEPEGSEPLDSPPDPCRVAQRALIQCAVVCRAAIDQTPDEPGALETYGRVRDWIDALGLAPSMEPLEAELFDAPLGTLDRARTITASWAAEGLAVLAWSLKRLDLPRHDEKVDPFDLTDSLGFLHHNAKALLDGVELRDPEELRACRELLYSIHCRIRQAQRRQGGKDFSNSIEPSWLDLLRIDRSHFLIDDDLAADEKALADVDQIRATEIEWIIRPRHQASIWLVGEYAALHRDAGRHLSLPCR